MGKKIISSRVKRAQIYTQSSQVFFRHLYVFSNASKCDFRSLVLSKLLDLISFICLIMKVLANFSGASIINISSRTVSSKSTSKVSSMFSELVAYVLTMPQQHATCGIRVDV
jgi:hypothetical protein